MEMVPAAGLHVVFLTHRWPSVPEVYRTNTWGIWDSIAGDIITSATVLLGHDGIMPEAPERGRNVLWTIVHCSGPRHV